MKPPRQRLECCSYKPKIHRIASKSPEAGKIHRRVLPSRFHREHKSANILISDFQTPELQNNTFLFLKPPTFWCFVWAALGNSYNVSTQCVVLCVWLCSLSMMLSSFIHGTACIPIHVFIWLISFLLYGYTTFCLSIHQFMN